MNTPLGSQELKEDMEIRYFELKFLEKRLKDMLKEKLDESITDLVRNYNLKPPSPEKELGIISLEVK